MHTSPTHCSYATFANINCCFGLSLSGMSDGQAACSVKLLNSFIPLDLMASE